MAKRNLTAVLTSAGMGTRLRPLNLYSPMSMIPKGLIRIMGIPIAELQLEGFKAAGLENVYIITQYLENREHLSNRFSDGTHRFGLNIYYSNPADDMTNNESGDAVLTNIERHNLTGDSICLSNDNLFEFNAGRVVEAHRDSSAVISIMTTKMNPKATIRSYGLVDSDANHKVTALLEKPEDEREIMTTLNLSDPQKLDDMSVQVNTAGYVLNNDLLSKISKEKWVVEGRKKINGKFDMAGALIKRLVEHGYPVYAIPIDAWGDFGSTNYFLDTFPKALNGSFPSVYSTLSKRNYKHFPKSNVWIHNDSLARENSAGKTLEQRIGSGKVRIGPNVFIGRDYIIEDDADISFTDLEKYNEVGKGAVIQGVYSFPYCRIGPLANLRECAFGLETSVLSSKESSTQINGRTVVGPRIVIPVGTRLDSTIIFPGYEFKGKGEVHSNKVLRPTHKRIAQILSQYI